MWRQSALVLCLGAIIWLAVITPMVRGEYEAREVGVGVVQALEVESGKAEASAAQSLTRDFLFFVTFVGQVVLFLIFFWEKPTTTKRWNVGEEAAREAQEEAQAPKSSERPTASAHEAGVTESKPIVANESHQVLIAPPEGSRATNEDGRASTQLDDDFEPLENTIRDLQHRISGLERTLNRRKGHYPTESLKSRLRECISTITGTLSSLEAQSPTSDPLSPSETDISPSPNRIDITKWPLESIQTSKRQLEAQLEQLEAAPAPLNDSPSLGTPSASASPPTSPSTDAPPSPKPSSTDDALSGTSPSPSKLEKSPSIISDPSGDGDIGDPELEMLAQQLLGNKKGRKGGVVKISARDATALTFLADGADNSQLEQSLGSSPALQRQSPTKAAPTEDTHTDSSEHHHSSDDSDSAPDTPTATETNDAEPENVTTDEDKKPSEEDELADLARLMASAPGKKSKKSSPTVPANIFNMFDPVVAPSDNDSEDSSPRSRSTGDRDDATNDLLAQLEGVPQDLSLPSDFSLPADDLNLSGDNDDLMAALNDISEAQKKSQSSDEESGTSDEGTDEDEDDSSDSDDSNTSDTSEDDENEELDEIAKERPVVTSFAAAEALNKSGLQRAKKTVALSKGGKKTYQMEDFHFCEFPWQNPNWGLFCVFDGHSGKECAEAAMRIFPTKLAENLKAVDLTIRQDIEEILTRTFLDTDAELTEFEYEGSTATIVFVYKTDSGHRYLQTANVGDSSACLIRKEQAVVLTEDHHPNYPNEVARLKELGIEINPGQTRLNGLAVSRALGDHFPKSTECGLIATPTVGPLIHLKDSDSHIILASDGLWDVISFQTAYEIIKDLDTPSEMAEGLLKTATRSSKCTDNVTTMVVVL